MKKAYVVRKVHSGWLGDLEDALNDLHNEGYWVEEYVVVGDSIILIAALFSE